MCDHEFQVCKTIQWIIPNFTKSFVQQYTSGQEMRTTSIDLLLGDNVTTWFITCFPNGDDDASQGSLSLMLRVYTEAPIKFVTNLKIEIFSKLSGTLKSKTIQQSQAFGWLFSSFMSHDELFRNSKLHNDKLGIILKLTLTAPRSESISIEYANGKSLATDLEKIFNEELFWDFELQANDGKLLKLHKAILAARSPTFYKFLNVYFKDAKNNPVYVSRYDSKTMKELLRFIYCNKIRDLDSIVNKLIYAAGEFKETQLEVICCERIISNLSVENVLEALVICDHINGLEKLFDECCVLVVRHYAVLSKSAEWKELSKDIVFRILDQTMKQS